MPSASVLATASGNTEVVAAVADQKVYLLGYQIVAKDSDLTVQLRSGTATVLVRGYTGADGVTGWLGSPISLHSEPYAVTAAGEALNVNLSGTGAVAVNVQYVQK